jgi:hypothetical protein
MDINEKAKIAAIYQEFSKADNSRPEQFVTKLEGAAKSAVQVMTNSNSLDKEQKTSVFDFGRMSEQFQKLSEQQLKIVDSVQNLARQVESLGHTEPAQDNWLSKTLSNYQRGYLENDIFTEAAGALVWIAAKAIQQIFFESDKGKQQQSVTELQKDIAKMTKALGTELARQQIEAKVDQRHGAMSEAISTAKQLEKNGQHIEADKLIINIHSKLNQSARKEYSHYEPRPDHQKVIAQAQSREKIRQSATASQNQLNTEPKIDRDKSKSIAR